MSHYTHQKFVLPLLTATLLMGCEPTVQSPPPAQNAITANAETAQSATVEKSYAVGSQFGNFAREYLKAQAEINEPLDEAIIIAAFGDALRDKASMDHEVAGKLVSEMRLATQKRRAEQFKAQQLASNSSFLVENGKKPGVTTTESGLQYEVLTLGTGPKPGPKDIVSVHYEGQLIDGKVFDSSFKRNAPATFSLDQVIKGWTEGLQLMPVGSKFRLTLPHDLGYGSRGALGGEIPPFATLEFVIELLDIQTPTDK
ncbi:FKBP-type peptidyl-prolyl cis-trans isomerase [Shewanella amazonensis]|uniref:Peptidyl-prolyl cis-trans isomerase n=1 Tax=Shewanella amazonensis (strain ATCC BAA-1098 / SB2B) TaxID=326297 RepID=A1S941_SHEAM|nr:FKBP-type peptidyl-prolyl cis-trans isomerase [Shewanella amazonensis]ABM00898.1 periplasmic peptidyl-prolyl cis-trans isomerase [Shewanella amazonensis SB2B]